MAVYTIEGCGTYWEGHDKSITIRRLTSIIATNERRDKREAYTIAKRVMADVDSKRYGKHGNIFVALNN